MQSLSVSHYLFDAVLLVLAAIGWKRALEAKRECRQEERTWEATALALKEELAKRRSAAGMTLVELLVAVVIVAILAGLALSAYSAAQNTARASTTTATIAKLNGIIMERYDSYRTRRVDWKLPAAMESLPANDPKRIAFDDKWSQPQNAARRRLDAIRDLMRMEMPDAKSDVTNGPIAFSWGKIAEPALQKLYASNPPTGDDDGAQCLYLVVSRSNPEAMEQFRQDEIGIVDGKPCFVDGWGNPIMWFRWAPGFVSPDSEIQSGDAVKDHDPFDAQRIEPVAFHMIPLIYSSGGRRRADGKPAYGLDTLAPTSADIDAGRDYYIYAGNPYNINLGKPIPDSGYHGNIDNHHVWKR